jgi:hypothetical protein
MSSCDLWGRSSVVSCSNINGYLRNYQDCLTLTCCYFYSVIYEPGSRPVSNQVHPIFGQTLDVLGLPWRTCASLGVLGLLWAFFGKPPCTLGQITLCPFGPWPLAPTSCYFYSVIYKQEYILFIVVLLFGCLSRIVVCWKAQVFVWCCHLHIIYVSTCHFMDSDLQSKETIWTISSP